MFDILDDNTNFTNLSAFPPNRSASMKKIPKKENRPSLFQEPKLNNSQNNNFDDLINGFLEKQSKISSQNGDNLSHSASKKGKFDSLDRQFDDIGKNRPSTPLNISSVNNYQRPSTAKSYLDDYHTHEQQKFSNHFGRTQQTIFNPSKAEDSFVSSRNMKPPIKRRENQSYLSANLFTSQIGMVIPQEDPTISNSSNKDDEYPKPGRSVNRRSSIDARSEINMDDSFSSKHFQNNPMASFKADRIKEEPLEKLSNTESHIIGWLQNDRPSKFASNLESKLVKAQASFLPIQQKVQPEVKQPANQIQIQQRIAKSNKAIITDYEKQIELVKLTYQKQITFLQQSLDKQISENREMRQKFMRETSKMIDQQRSRSKRLQEEDVNRLKDMFQWQKKKITQTLRCQIQSLKSVVEYKNQNINTKTNTYHDKFEFESQEIKLKLLQSSLQEKSQMLERRQRDLQQKISQLNIQKRQDDERLRKEQRRLMEMQMNFKRQMMTEKKQLSAEKQMLSSQLGDLELEVIRGKENNEVVARQNEIERESLEKEKIELRRASYEIMQSHKANIEEIQQQKQRLSEIELQLMKKIRVVELKARQINANRNNEEQTFCITHEQPSNLKEKQRCYMPVRKLSKELNSKSMSNILKTKDRFYQVEMNTRSKLNTSIKDHKKLDLGNYMSRIESFSRKKF